MKTITVINQKGGCGKTTTAAAIGAGLMLKGYKVLFVDLDAQGNLSYTLGVSNSNEQSAYSVLLDPATIKDAIVENKDGAYVLPSTPMLSTVNLKLMNKPAPDTRLSLALNSIESEFDYCIIDTPPALGFQSSNALQAAEFVIIPTQADVFGLVGIGQLFATAINDVKEYKQAVGTELHVLGIVLTRHSARSILSRDVADALKEAAEQFNTKLFNTTIRECIALKEAQVTQADIFSYAPKSNAAADYAALIEEILDEVKKYDK